MRLIENHFWIYATYIYIYNIYIYVYKYELSNLMLEITFIYWTTNLINGWIYNWRWIEYFFFNVYKYSIV